jgi:hypothetical protein
MRFVRLAVGTLLLVVSVPVILAGTALLLAMQHRTATGTFTAQLEPLRAGGHAVVVTDVDALLRADMPYARGGQTTLSLSARGPGGPLFLGIAPYERVDHYLAGVARTQVMRVRPAKGPLPVDTEAVDGTAEPSDPPTGRAFWLATSTGLTRDGRVEDALTWSPSALRGQRLALVVMNADGSAGVDVTLTVAMRAGWLGPTTWGSLILGTAVLLLGILALGWPESRRELLYIVDQAPPPGGSLGLPPPPPVGLQLTWQPIEVKPAAAEQELLPSGR